MISFLKKISLTSLFRNRTFCIVLSVVLAFVLWMYVVITISPDIERTIHDVPIDLSTASGSQLKAVNNTDATATVVISGKRYLIGSLTKNDIVVKANTELVSSAGYYNLTVDVTSDDGGAYYVVSVSPESLLVKFDRIITKEIAVTADIPELIIPDGYIHDDANDVIISPNTVTVTGPENVVSRIEEAVISAEFDEPLYESSSSMLDIQFLDANSEAVSDPLLSATATQAELYIKINRIVELPLTLSYINIPTNFPSEELSYQLSNETITVAAEESVLKNYHEIVLGYINFRQLDIVAENTMTFTVNLPSTFINVNNIETVIAEFYNADMVSEYLNLKEFKVINVPDGYTATVTTTALNNVKFIGDKESIKNLSAGDIIVEIDLSDREITTGQYQMPVSIYAPTAGLVWTVGEYDVVVNVKEG